MAKASGLSFQDLRNKAAQSPQSLTLDELRAINEFKDLYASHDARPSTKILPVPSPSAKRMSPKAKAKLYMQGSLDEADYAFGGGINRVMRMADSAESDIASLQALQMLGKLAELEYDVEEVKSIPISIVKIHQPEDKVVRMQA